MPCVKKLCAIAYCLLLWVLPSLLYAQSAAEPERLESTFTTPIKINKGWLFYKTNTQTQLEDVKHFQHWKPVTLPHTPRLEPLLVNDLWQGDAWYQYTLKYQPEWQGKHIYLDFEAAMRVAKVWINGTPVAEHWGGYLPFTADLTEHLKAGDNRILVKLDNRDNPRTGPKPLEDLDFTTYGGLYRNVWLRVENPVHVAPAVTANRPASGGVFVTFPKVGSDFAEIAVQTHVFNHGQNTDVQVIHELRYQNKLVVRQVSKAFAIERETEHRALLAVPEPNLWHPRHPHLYDLTTYVVKSQAIVDEEHTRIGIRSYEARSGELLINGEPFFLRGINRHQEYPYIGYALSDAANYRDAERIKAAGFDYVRLSHYPHATAFIEAADELGLVLIDAILGWQYVSDDPAFNEQVIQTCEDMIRRDRNHPSVFAWECSLNESDMPPPLVDQLVETVHREYPGRHVYAAGWLEQGYDIYLQARQHRLSHYEPPNKPYIVSEYGDWEYYAMNAGLNQHNWSDLLQAERSSRQRLEDGEVRLQQQLHNVMEAHNDNFNTPAIGDGYWVMYDYNRGYANDLETSGIMSIDRRPKFTYHFFRSQRSANDCGALPKCGPMVFIASFWDTTSPLTLPVLSNADEVKLYLNGHEIPGQRARKRYPHLDHPPFYFTLDKFTPGTLRAVAFVNGKQVAEHSVHTPGALQAIQLRRERSDHQYLDPDSDTVFIYADLVDVQGHPLRSNNIPVAFTVTGARILGPSTVDTRLGTASTLVRLEDSQAVTVRASVEHNNQRLQSSLEL